MPCKYPYTRQFVDGRRVTLPCGRCMLCRLEYKRQWAIRCMHEASLHSENSFITLTYDDDNLPSRVFVGTYKDELTGEDKRAYLGTLVYEHFRDFMKRLRKWVADNKVVDEDEKPLRLKYYHSGEYGETNGRPHYHACLFGFDFPDKTIWAMRDGFPVFRSALLERLWNVGMSEIGSVTFESAAYVAGYITKRVTGDAAAAHYRICDIETGEVVQALPEYSTMSRRPGIGAAWLSRYRDEVLSRDGVVVRGVPMRPPRYYDRKMTDDFPEVMEKVRLERLHSRFDKDAVEMYSPSRIAARVAVAEAAANLKG